MAITPIVIGNWKMHGLTTSLDEISRLLALVQSGHAPAADIMICPPATLLERAHGLLQHTAVALGAQDCHPAPSGAHTGDISAEMLADAGASAVIVGHSERRIDHGETDALVAAKAAAAHRARLTAIICIGESEQERNDGATLQILKRQLQGSVPQEATAANTVIAYEPVWAIGSGRTPTSAEVTEIHGFVRRTLASRLREGEGDSMRILYGGSVKPANAATLLRLPDVNGALVGGASLKAQDFYDILATYAENRVA